ncbi:hypothetical protein CY652_22385 [Burkholderia sp. WAC0059]|uniref:MobQ family relaxase n=1 Tax=Burkholderia sp. WAC0059 TaxID=2066022 RepID=UPI000CCB12E4|nr:MobQ family relaxase [Burkholderia sp. WAC0059]PLZ00195.1 hypothetical protein CY652_22385 [Burkholderia sp. WAC0059]
MAQFHMSVKAIGRSEGRSATAAAAYRSAERIVDDRTGEVHDYTHKRGVIATVLVLPSGAMPNRAEFWNAVEQHHKRGDAVLAREFTLALPAEMNSTERQRLAFDYGRELSNRYGVAVDVALHEPDKAGDQRNYHAHVLMSACTVAPDGTLGKKAVELDPIHCQRAKIENFAERERPRWADLHNERMAENGLSERIDHRTLEAQGINREPTQHLGPAAIGYERRTALRSNLRLFAEAEAIERLQRAAQIGQLEREGQALTQLIIDTETDLHAAIAECESALEAQRTVTALERVIEEPTQIPDRILAQAAQRLEQYSLQSGWGLSAQKIAMLRERIREELRRRELAARTALEIHARENRENRSHVITSQMLALARATQQEEKLGQRLRAELAERMRIIPQSMLGSADAIRFRNQVVVEFVVGALLKKGLVEQTEVADLVEQFDAMRASQLAEIALQEKSDHSQPLESAAIPRRKHGLIYKL